jgi:hypothetical protein
MPNAHRISDIGLGLGWDRDEPTQDTHSQFRPPRASSSYGEAPKPPALGKEQMASGWGLGLGFGSSQELKVILKAKRSQRPSEDLVAFCGPNTRPATSNIFLRN